MLEESKKKRLRLVNRWKPKGIEFPDSLWEDELYHLQYGERKGGQSPYPDIAKIMKRIKKDYESVFSADTSRKQTRWPLDPASRYSEFFLANAAFHCAVVIPTEGRPQLLKQCLDTIQKNSKLRLSVLIVDDGAKFPVNRLPFIRDRKDQYDFPITVKRPGKGKRQGAGFGRAYGQSYWHNRGRHWVIQMDDDAFIHEHCFENLYANAMIHDNYGIIGAIGSFRKFYQGNWQDEFSINAIGVCYIVNKWAIELCGNFDRRMRARQDVDLAIRLWLNGFRVCVLPKADVNHIRFRTKKEEDPDRVSMFQQWKVDAGQLIGKKYEKFGLKVSSNGTLRYMAAFEKQGFVRRQWCKTKAGGK